MTLDQQLNLVFQFCARLGMLMLVIFIAAKLARLLARPQGTYGAGLPERRSRPRLVLSDPAAVAARLEASHAAKAA